MSDGPGSRAARIARLTPARRDLLMQWIMQRELVSRPTVVRRQPRIGDGPYRFPATPGQQRLHFLHQMDPASVAYVLPIALRIRGDLDIGALQATLRWLIDRHETLRTVCEVSDDGIVEQIVHPTSSVDFAVQLDKVTAGDVPGAIAARTGLPFDLGSAPPLRAALLEVTSDTAQLPEPEWVLVLAVHHIAVDGWSFNILVREIQLVYPVFAAGRTPNVAPPPLQYADFAVWQRDAMPDVRAQLEYWRTCLDGAPMLRLPADRPAAEWSTAGARVEVRLDPDRVAALEALATSGRCTLFMVLTAALATMLRDRTTQDDMVLYSPVAGRPHADLHDAVGYFVNTVALRVRADPGLSFRNLLDHVRGVCADAFDHQDVPVDEVVRALRRAGQQLDAQVMVALRNVDRAPLQLPGLVTDLLEITGGGAQVPLAFEFVPVADGSIVAILEYATDQFDHDTAERLIADLDAVLADAVLADAVDLRTDPDQVSDTDDMPVPAEVSHR